MTMIEVSSSTVDYCTVEIDAVAFLIIRRVIVTILAKLRGHSVEYSVALCLAISHQMYSTRES